MVSTTTTITPTLNEKYGDASIEMPTNPFFSDPTPSAPSPTPTPYPTQAALRAQSRTLHAMFGLTLLLIFVFFAVIAFFGVYVFYHSSPLEHVAIGFAATSTFLWMLVGIAKVVGYKGLHGYEEEKKKEGAGMEV
jgi:uncharacterized integral membrane protein